MTYEYTCVECKHAWTEQASIKAPPTTECPSCHRPTAQRLINALGGFMVRGGSPSVSSQEQQGGDDDFTYNDGRMAKMALHELREHPVYGTQSREVTRGIVPIPDQLATLIDAVAPDALSPPAPRDSKDLNLTRPSP